MPGLYRRPPQPQQRRRFQTQGLSFTGTGAGTQAAASGVYVNAVRADNPVAYWRLGEASGEVVDSVGAAFGATVGTVTRDVSGLLNASDDGAIDVGASGGVSVPDSTPLDLGNGPFTIEAWVRFDTVSSTQTIASKSAGGGYQLSIDGSNSKLITVKTGTEVSYTGSTVLSTATPYHVAWVKVDPGTGEQHLYLNGVEETLTGSGSSYVNTGGPLLLGHDEFGDHLDGKLDEVAIYATALSQAQVQAHYAAAQPTASGLETFTGTGAGTQAAQTSSGSGTAIIDVTGTGAATQIAQSGAGSALETFTATGAGTQAAQTSSGDGLLTIATGTGAGTQVAQSGSGSGDVAEPGITGTGAGTQIAQSGSGAGLETVTGTGAGTGTAATGLGSATETFTGTGAGTQTTQSGAGSGNSLIAVTGTGAAVQAAQTGAGSGLQTQAVTGTGAGTQQPATAAGIGIGGISEAPSHGHGAPLGAARVIGPAGDRTIYLRPVTGNGAGEQPAASAYGTGNVNDDELVLMLLEAA